MGAFRMSLDLEQKGSRHFPGRRSAGVRGSKNIQLLGKVSTYCRQLLDIKKLFLRGPCLQYLTEQEVYRWKGVHRHKVHNFKLGMKLLAIFCPVNPGKNHSYWEYLVGG